MPRDDDLFIDALETPAEERVAFLAQACAGDAAQQVRVEALLRGHGQAPACFDRPGLGLATGEQPGTTIGRYRLIERIGEGGCGIVWLAEQREPVRRRVALKLLRPGMDTKELLARFEAERQALALMDHPHIAKVFEAGATVDGRPFFVMERVPGPPITRFCDDARLSTAERLRLFLAVCEAIQHAHQKGIIHRDLKPSNILVADPDATEVSAASDGTTPLREANSPSAAAGGSVRPMVIDFGIAKALHGRLTDVSVVTVVASFLGTPAYMSPEQAAGIEVDTRTDLYSLGALLYELLAGHPPFDPTMLQQAGIDEIRRIVREVEPARPSARLGQLSAAERDAVAHARRTAPAQLLAQLVGDLDWVVMKALEKERSRRYESAGAFAADVRRHLAHEPVLAFPPSHAYLLRKFVRRHRGAFAAAAAIAATLVLGAGASGWQAWRATQSEREQSRLRAVEPELRAAAEAQTLAMRRRAYASDLNLAQRSLADGNLGRVQELLHGQRPRPGETDLRGWEWRHLWQRTQGDELSSFPPGPHPAGCAVWSPDGNVLATGGLRQAVQVWTSSGRQRLAALTGTERGVMANSLAFAPDGKRLAAASGDRVVIWDPGNWQALGQIPVEARNEYSQSIAFSPDGSAIAVLSGHEIQFFDTQSRQRQAVVKPEEIPHGLFCLSDDWALLAVGGRNRTEIWDRATALKVAELPGWTVALAFAPGGRQLAVGDYGGNVLLWDAAARRPLHRWKAHRSAVRGVSFSPDGTRLATGGEDQAIHVWEVATGRRLSSRLGHRQSISAVAFAPDGHTLVSTSADGTVRFWSMHAAALPAEPDLGHVPLWFSHDGRILATIGAGPALQYWDTTARKLVRSVPLPFAPAATVEPRLAADGKTVALSRPDGAIELWNSETRQTTGKLPAAGNATVETIAFSPDQRWLAAITQTRDAREKYEGLLWDLTTHQLAARFPAGRTALAFSPDSRRVAAIHRNAVQLWDVDGLRRSGGSMSASVSLEGPAASPYVLEFSPDGRLLAGGGRSFAARIWEVESGRHVADAAGHVGGVFNLAFSPDGRTLVTGSVDGAARFWDTATWQELMTVSDRQPAVTRVLFSPDGTLLAVGRAEVSASDAAVQLWRAPAWAEIEAAEKAQRAAGGPN